MNAILLLGFLLGMRHALEADHVAAVATLAARSHSRREAMVQGAVWGLGHTVTLFLACSVVLFLDTAVPERLAQGLEAAVGVMLVLLGADLLRRMRRERIHFHAHRHHDGITHFHAHSHAGETARRTSHDAEPHIHAHAPHFPVRALCIGLVHGLAGSAALILLALTTVSSPALGLLYVALFGLGSIGGMALLSLAISLPLRSTRRFTGIHHGLQLVVALATVAVGVMLVYENTIATAA